MAREARVLRGGLAVSALLVSGVLVWAWLSRPAPNRAAAPAPVAAEPPSHAPAPSEAAATGWPVPPSLVGTEVDGALPVDAEGHLLVTKDVLDFFDYYLAASGEEPLSVTRARVAAEIEARLPAPAQPAARDLFERTLAYREAVRALHEEGLDAAPLERRLQRVREVRRAFFTAEERQAFFAAEEAVWEVDLERQRVARDPELSPAERRAHLDALAEALPPEVREVRAAALSALQLQRDEAAERAEGASDAEIQALRERRFGPEAAARLHALDQRRAAFDARLAAWWAEADGLRAAGAGATELDAARAERFAGPELARVRALDRLRERDAEGEPTQGSSTDAGAL